MEWLRFFFAESFPLDWGTMHEQMVDRALQAISHGGRFVVAAPRGSGKTTLMWALTLFVVLLKSVSFPAYLPWSARDVKRALRFWRIALCFNARLARYYPEVTFPFVASRGHAQKLNSLVRDGKGTGAHLRISDGMIVLPDSLGVLGSATINGNPRGLNHATESGGVLRPDFILVDDPQDKETARSQQQCRNVINIIDSDIAGMAGPNKSLPLVLCVTVLCRGDVADHYLSDDVEWQSLRVPQIVSWPDNMAAWEKWNEVRIAGEKQDDGGRAGLDHYATHRDELIRGMAVSWASRFDTVRGDPDAYYAAMRDYYRMGKSAFLAERQNAPMDEVDTVFTLTSKTVSEKVNGMDRCQLPDDTSYVVAFADINHDGIRWAVAATSNQRVLSVVDYGIFPGGGAVLFDPECAQESEAVAVARGLAGLGTMLNGWRGSGAPGNQGIDYVMVDCGGRWMQSVFAACARIGGKTKWECSRGTSASRYRPTRRIGRAGEQYYRTLWSGKGRVVVHDADFWRLRQQRGWLLPAAAPDAISLFGQAGQVHSVFADSVTAEQLAAYAETPQGILYRWHMRVGSRNDWGDVATGLYVAAAVMGCGPDKVEVKSQPQEEEKDEVEPEQQQSADEQQQRVPDGRPWRKRGKVVIGRGGVRY
jgi:hypothetical protein